MNITFHHHHHLDLATERRLDLLLRTLVHNQEIIMSAISDFAAKQNAFLDALGKATTDIQTELKALTDQVTALQNSNGTITPEDQALLDGIQSRTASATAAAQALDTLTPPTPPASTAQ